MMSCKIKSYILYGHRINISSRISYYFNQNTINYKLTTLYHFFISFLFSLSFSLSLFSFRFLDEDGTSGLLVAPEPALSTCCSEAGNVVRCSSSLLDWTRWIRLKKSSSGTVGADRAGKVLR